MRKAVQSLKKQRIFLTAARLGRIVKRLKKTGSVSQRRRSGRPSTLKPGVQAVLCQIARTHRSASFPALAHELSVRGGPRISRWTIGRVLKKRGYARRVAVRLPLLTAL